MQPPLRGGIPNLCLRRRRDPERGCRRCGRVRQCSRDRLGRRQRERFRPALLRAPGLLSPGPAAGCGGNHVRHDPLQRFSGPEHLLRWSGCPHRHGCCQLQAAASAAGLLGLCSLCGGECGPRRQSAFACLPLRPNPGRRDDHGLRLQRPLLRRRLLCRAGGGPPETVCWTCCW